MTKPFRHSKIKKSYDPKELFPSLRYWLSRQQILFLQLNLVFIADSRTGFHS